MDGIWASRADRFELHDRGATEVVLFEWLRERLAERYDDVLAEPVPRSLTDLVDRSP